MTKQHRKDPIPGKKASREELARFWDTHSFADYWNEFQPVKVKFAKPLSHILAVRFDSETFSKLGKEAVREGVSPTALVRMWVREHLNA